MNDLYSPDNLDDLNLDDFDVNKCVFEYSSLHEENQKLDTEIKDARILLDKRASRITELEQREAELLNTVSELKEEVHHLKGSLTKALDKSSEHDAQVIEKAQKYVIQFFPRRADSIHAGLKHYSNNLRNQAKDGE